MRRRMYRGGRASGLARVLRRVSALRFGSGFLVAVDRHAAVADFESTAADYPVFRLTPRP